MKNTILVNGKRKSCRIYDNGGESADRYTACYRAVKYDGKLYYPYVGFSEMPFNPLGIAQHGEARCKIDKNDLGKRISFESLNADCQKLILNDLK